MCFTYFKKVCSEIIELYFSSKLFMKSIILIVLSVLFTHGLYAQGCVAIRGNNSLAGSTMSNEILKGDVIVQLGYRHFKSFRHFRGAEEETNRVEQGTEVINNSNFADFGISYAITKKLLLNTVIPFSYHTRSSMYEHGGNPPNGLGERNTTSSKGLGDIRIGLNYSIYSSHNHFVAGGIGIKLPTGNYNYMDTFYNQGPNKDQDILTVVDQSIQLGDGGTGVYLEFLSIHNLIKNLSFQTNLYYLSNFQETNGVLTRNGNMEFSCPDQYAARLGLNYMYKKVSFYGGARLEGVNAFDLIGGSEGYRRPGYAISIEPGISINQNSFTFLFTMPWAIYRNRIQSFDDIKITEDSGVYKHGDAAFADYLINLGISYKFSTKKEPTTIIIK